MKGVADVLNGAADLIERDGWVQGRLHGPQGQRCAAGALCDIPSRYDVYAEAYRVMERQLGCWLSTWNDTPGRTQAEIVAALRAAAERAS